MTLSTQIRRQFLEYFKNKNHRVVPSSSVIPHNDPTLLFVNAGMNQFKSYFLGEEEPISLRATSTQKCVRVGGKHNDLENVGHTSRHLTFFEMLGNFSFGDYFKKEAIEMAWDVTNQILKLDIDKLWVSVYHDDQEAMDYWKKYLPESRIVRIETDDNFWAMGDQGLCGPCTELFIDKGKEYGNARSPKEDVQGERFFEFWNLVFMQYDRGSDNTLHPLPKPCVDTGMGLERIVSLMMGVDNIFESDLLAALVQETQEIFKLNYKEQNADRKAAFHVIVDHLRTLSFAIADGVQPSNLDRGYILRKVLRRAVRYGRQLGANKPFMGALVPKLIELMGEDFPELGQSKARIEEILLTEEEAFLRTLKRGGNLLGHVIKSAQASEDQKITGDDAFKLKDTYGLPLEEIQLMALDSHLTVDLERYDVLEKEAKNKSRQAHEKVSQNVSEGFYKELTERLGKCEFCGYEVTQTSSKVIACLQNGLEVDELPEGSSGQVILDCTPFYAEMGGQVADRGTLAAQDALFVVKNVQSPYSRLITHEGTVKKGTIKKGMRLDSQIDETRRHQIAVNHTATHLLHWALTQVLGEHVKQAGSLVEPDRLRFDFSHHKAIETGVLHQIEDLINEKIRANLDVKTYELAYQDALSRTDIKQMFGEKYGNTVRVIDVEFSKELCGGTHTSRTGNIGLFRITKESSIAAGVRRIEAVTGQQAEKFCREQEVLLEALSHSLKTTPIKLSEKLSQLLFDHKNLVEHNKHLAKERNKSLIDGFIQKAESMGNVQLILASLNLPREDLREFAIQLTQKAKRSICVVATHEEGSVSLVVALTEDLKSEKLSAKNILTQIVEPINGRGGGKDLFAQAGGSHPEKIPEVFELAKQVLQKSC